MESNVMPVSKTRLNVNKKVFIQFSLIVSNTSASYRNKCVSHTT